MYAKNRKTWATPKPIKCITKSKSNIFLGLSVSFKILKFLS